jgi:hypothetical protein
MLVWGVPVEVVDVDLGAVGEDLRLGVRGEASLVIS